VTPSDRHLRGEPPAERVCAECGRIDVRVSNGGRFCSRCSERTRLRGEQPKEPRPLTCRQREVFRCLARGLSYQEAADELGMSLFTVQKHVSHGLTAAERDDPRRGLRG
jgi:DNA-binding NarL/FixJ family response regulator